MKVGRFTVNGTDRVGLFDDRSVTDISDTVDSFSQALEKVTEGTPLQASGVEFDLGEITYLPPTTETNQVFGVALNYRSHIDETDTDTPERPLIFMKPYRSLIGHRQPIRAHREVTAALDYEAELAAVIGKSGWNVGRDEALSHVAGYTILNDTSARDIQRMALGDAEILDWFSGKALQYATPVGPYVVTAEEVSDPQHLQIESKYNGKVMQDENTSLMIRDVAELVSFISTRVRLYPGDVIATGTPEGVGDFQDIQLTEGDTIEIAIEDIGTLVNTIQSFEEP